MISAAVTEIVLRVLYRDQDAIGSYFGAGAYVQDDLAGYRHTPGFQSEVHRRGAFVCRINIDQNGLRQSNFDAQRQYSKRVLLLGDSFAFGLGVDEDDAFAARLQKALNPEGVGVINGGQTGYCAGQEARFGIALSQTIRPDLIVLALYPGNDVKGDYFQEYKNVKVENGLLLPADRWLPLAPIDFLRTRSYAWLIIETALRRKKIEALNEVFQSLARDSTEQVVRPTVEALALLQDFCRENSIRLGVMMIPQFGKAGIFDASLKRALSAAGVPVLDLAEKKFGRKHYLSGDAHWNEKGHERAAQYLAPFCQEFFKNRENK